MSDKWYGIAGPSDALTQGDIIFECPVLAWKNEPFPSEGAADLCERLRAHFESVAVDVVVMTQACDLAQEKVRNVTLCAHYAIETWRQSWEQTLKAKGHSPTAKAWQNQCEDIQKGFVWNLSMLDKADLGTLRMAHRIVDFHEIFTVPREFLESLIAQRGHERLRLFPPYREHLSQAFARFYMRVGLPVEIVPVW